MASDSENSQLSPQQSFKTLDSETSPNKRLKTLTSLPSPSYKGKQKIEETKDEFKEDPTDSNNCGICLSEDGKAIRGWIDSCDHYFCFVCIMEWAKVESRCPMCKRRFTTIRRPPKDGVFDCDRLVNVPVRDQVYHCFGNATIGPPDPYAEVKCSVCHGAADENFLLLCDLCDSAAHTYCVGLGATVPEGDWFCQDCAVSKAEHANSEIDTDCGNQTVFRKFDRVPSAEENVSIFDIVRESNIPEVERPPTIVSSHPNRLSSPNVLETEISVADKVTDQGAKTFLNARTLRRCRNVHSHIRALRQNWNALRSGSLSFSSRSVDSGGSSSQKHGSGVLLCDKSGQPHSSSSTSCPQLTTQDGSSCDILHNRGSHDIDKAWKMMDIAKSTQRARTTSIVRQASKHPFSIGNAPKEAANINSSLFVYKSKPLGTKNLGSVGAERPYQYHSLEKENDKLKCQNFKKEKESRITVKGTLQFSEAFPTTRSPVYCELPSSRKVQTPVQVDVCHGNGRNISQENLPEGSSSGVIEGNGSTCLTTRVGSVPGASNISYPKLELSASSSCKVELSEGKVRVEKSRVKSKARKDDAKSEIQSLVKLNLKLLSADKKLGVIAFKEVARLATHTILAACGLEHPKSGVHSFPSSVCCHTDQIQKARMSTLMPSSCRECFYVFVKDVVNSIMLEKMGRGKLSC